MEIDKKWLVRHSQPNTYDQVPFGTECRVRKDGDWSELYIQISKDEEKPLWIQV